jgi:hypothetical protein
MADRTALMTPLEREAHTGTLRWLRDEHGYAVIRAEWPVLSLQALWTVIELRFEQREEATVLTCSVGVVGEPAPLPAEVVAARLGVELGEPAPTVAAPADIANAAAHWSGVLDGPLRAPVAGDLSALGARGGSNLPSAEPPGRGTDPLEASLSEEERSAMIEALEQGLHRHASWLWEAGLEPVERGWPGLRLVSPRAGLRIWFYGIHHGAPPPALAFALDDPDGDALRSYELRDLLPGGERLDTPIEAADAEAAASELADRLVLLRPLLEGDADAWRELRRGRAELQARDALDTELRTALPRADEAFRRRDFRAVVEALDSLDGQLPRAAQRKLDHARAQLS